MAESIRLPGPGHRTAIVGRTGSGKTIAAIWHLSNADFDQRPFIILDYKNDEHINSIARAYELDYDTLPDEPGIYILKVLPGDADEGKVSAWFKSVWEHEDLGILIDEGYMIDPRDQWFNACLTQGRSKNISMIILSQRPVWLSRFVFSESDFFQVFDLTHSKDMDKVREYVRDDDRQQLDQQLAEYNSFYYDVGKRRLETFGPVPEESELLAIIDGRLAELEVVVDDQGEERPRRRSI